MRSPLRAVVFDLDGTLVDSYGAIAECFNHARTMLGEPALPEAAVRRMVGHGLEFLMEEAVGRERAPHGVRLFRERYDKICEVRTTVLPEVPETLELLARAGLRLGVATNKPAAFAGRILRSLALAPPLEAVAGPSSRLPPKPEPAMLWHVLAALGVRTEAALYVGDMPLDVETARRAGLLSWVVPTGSSTREELETAGADRVLGRFADLADLLEADTRPDRS